MAAPSLWAARLGYAGLAPFIGLSVATYLLPAATRGLATGALIAYAASITSFLGAIHWGLAMRDADTARAAPYVWGVVPSLVAWVCLLVSPAIALGVLALLLCACYAVDRQTYPRRNLQVWLPMRLRLTVIASASCLLAVPANF